MSSAKLLSCKSKTQIRERFRSLIVPPDPSTEGPIKKRPAGAQTGAGEEPIKKRPATGAAMKRPSACTAIVPFENPDATNKDRNKWGFLMRNKDTLDPQVLQMLEGANQNEQASIVNNVVRRGKTGKWEFNLDNPQMVDKLAKFEQRYCDQFDQGQPLEVAEHMWGGIEKLNKAIQDGSATKVEREGKIYIKWGGFRVGKKTGVQAAHGVKAGAAISGQQAIEFSSFMEALDFGFVLKKTERQVMVELYTINMC